MQANYDSKLDLLFLSLGRSWNPGEVSGGGEEGGGSVGWFNPQHNLEPPYTGMAPLSLKVNQGQLKVLSAPSHIYSAAIVLFALPFTLGISFL